MENQKKCLNENKNYNVYVTTIFIILLILSIFLIKLALRQDKKLFIQYNDKKDLGYQVILKENEYYQDTYMEKGNQYIANLIQSIHADFNYHFALPTSYDYQYKIVGTVDVVDEKTNKTIYTFSEDLLPEQTGQSDGSLDISQNIQVNYEKYNNLIRQFVAAYDLKNVTCQLKLNLNLGISSNTQQFAKQNFNVMNLSVPLAMNTISIDTNYDLSNQHNLIEIQQEQKNPTPFFISGIAILVLDFLFLIIFFIYRKKTETEEDKYNNNLKKILNNYDSYISRVEDDFNMQEYQILKVQRFTDLLEIRDTMQLPIIMLENKEQLVTCFVIPTPSHILYFYSIGVTQYTLPAGKNNSTLETRKNNEQKV